MDYQEGSVYVESKRKYLLRNYGSRTFPKTLEVLWMYFHPLFHYLPLLSLSLSHPIITI